MIAERALAAASGSRSRTRRAAAAWMPIDRHVVADDVVQLAGDAQPLVDDGLRRRRVSLWAWMVLACSAQLAPSGGRCATTPGHR